MQFEWDEEKRKANIRKHGFDFRDACNLFSSPMMVAPDDRYDYGEDRWIGIGMLEGRTVVVVFTERNDTVRIVSMMKALSHERIRYEYYLRNRLGTD
ncbi:MAG: BrnT family toxin [Desulfococcaceae bacterium]